MKTAIKPLPGFKFGCDPELFVRNREGKIVSAHDLLPGTKDEPYKVEHGAIQVDGTAAEFNIDPASTFEEFDRNIVAVMKTLLKMLPKGYQLTVVPAVKYDQDEWDRIPPSAKVLGCTPDFNAWTSNVNPSPDPVGDLERVRTASGHLHIGWTENINLSENIEHLQHCNDLVKQLDWYLGYWSLSQDNDNTRRSLYGKAGACRYKPYGVEYRVLSNFWLSNKSLRLEVWNRMQRAIWDMSSMYLPSLFEKSNIKIVQAINNSNRDLVGTLIFNRAYPLQSINK
jgi:hypothetical protein